MKAKLLSLFTVALVVAAGLTSCDKDDPEVKPTVITLGAQANTELPSFLSISEMKVYTLETAAAAQDKIDIICIYEEGRTLMGLSSPGSIKGIFPENTHPNTWEVKHITYYTELEITVDEFNALNDGDEAIANYFVEDDGRQMSRDLKVGDIRCFKTESGTIGIILVKEVEQGEEGYVKFEVKTK